MGLKILHTADWHLGSAFRQFQEPHREYLKQQQKLLPQKVADLCRREHCQMVLLSGDIFDGQPSRDLIDLVKNTLRSCGVPVLISPGNHDFYPGIESVINACNNGGVIVLDNESMEFECLNIFGLRFSFDDRDIPFHR